MPTRKPAHPVRQPTIQEKIAFSSLASQLSPENLCCDGELRGRALAAKKRRLDAEWKALEAAIGRKVNEEETYRWDAEIRAYQAEQKRAAMAKEPQHPGLEHNNPGVWSKKGQNGMSAYYIWGPSKGDGKNYRLFSEFGYRMGGREEIGSYATLAAAAEAGDAFLKTVTFESFKAKHPQWWDENIRRELLRLPA